MRQKDFRSDEGVATAAPGVQTNALMRSRCPIPDVTAATSYPAHISWFFDTFLLNYFEADFTPRYPVFRMLFKSYCSGVGNKSVRPYHGLMTRPSLVEVIDDLKDGIFITIFAIRYRSALSTHYLPLRPLFL